MTSPSSPSEIAPPVFRRHGPDLGATPLVFASPHSGDVYPSEPDPHPDLTPAFLRSAEDALMETLARSAAEAVDAPLLAACIGRAYIDLNRAPDDLDPAAVAGADAVEPSPRARAGYGVIPRLSGDGRPLRASPLPRHEADRRLTRIHGVYHAELARLMEATRAAHGRAVLIDWHSMPGRAAGARPGVRGIDVVLGDRHGAACDAALVRRARAALEAKGLRVSLNRPYAGGWSTERWGRPAEGLHALQVEINRELYLDSVSLSPGPGFARATAVAVDLARALADGLRTEKKPRPRARHESL
ncbi:N-formylglutamate amidohydrolase [Brevundimonas balnearis]|uniref:N-formylglutamate amidohydrolase n=1 Tax=Brevundimonas balnearis TaxID=1572858 RepID=A0ABV6R1V4_9CAUL